MVLTVVVPLTCCKNALVVVGKLDKVYSISLAIVGVDFFSAL